MGIKLDQGSFLNSSLHNTLKKDKLKIFEDNSENNSS